MTQEGIDYGRSLPKFVSVGQTVNAIKITKSNRREIKRTIDMFQLNANDNGNWMVWANGEWQYHFAETFEKIYQPAPLPKEEAFRLYCRNLGISDGLVDAFIWRMEGKTLSGVYFGLDNVESKWMSFSAGYDAATGKVGS